MVETIRKVEYFYAMVEDEPGAATRLLKHFSEEGINLVAMNAFSLSDGRAQIDFMAEIPDKLLKVAMDAGVALFGPKKAFLIQGEDKVGAIIEYHQLLSFAGINVHSASGVSDGKGRFGYVLWVKQKDFERAAQVLGV